MMQGMQERDVVLGQGTVCAIDQTAFARPKDAPEHSVRSVHPAQSGPLVQDIE